MTIEAVVTKQGADISAPFSRVVTGGTNNAVLRATLPPAGVGINGTLRRENGCQGNLLLAGSRRSYLQICGSCGDGRVALRVQLAAEGGGRGRIRRIRLDLQGAAGGVPRLNPCLYR